MLLKQAKLLMEHILIEAQRRLYSYCCIRIFGPYKNHIFNLLKLFKEEDLRKVDGTDIERDTHVTVMYGITAVSKRDIIKLFTKRKKFKIYIEGLEVFKNKEYDYDVVVIRVNSKELLQLRKEIEETLPHITTHREYKPHITLAYVKGGKGEEYKELIEKHLRKDSINIDKIYFDHKSGKKLRFNLH